MKNQIEQLIFELRHVHGFEHSTIVAEYLLKVLKMEIEDKTKSGPYIFPKK